MNKVYKLVFNQSIKQWVVTSELAKGKTKKSRASLCGKILHSLFVTLGFIGSLSGVASAAPPNCVGGTCTLDGVWDFSSANNGAGRYSVSDGGVYDVIGPNSIYRQNQHRPNTIRVTIKHAYENGMVTSGSEHPDDLKPVDFDVKKAELITVNNGGVASTVVVQTAESVLTSQEYEYLGATTSSTIAEFFYDAGFVKVTDGTANVRVSAPLINGYTKNTIFAHAVGTGTNNANITWRSNNIYAPSVIDDDFKDTSVSKTTTLKKAKYNGTFTGLDGSAQNVTDVESLKAYIVWLKGQVESNKITTQSQYDTELKKAYKNENYVYSYTIPGLGSAFPEATAKKTGDALILAEGAKATVNIAQGVTLTQQGGSYSSAASDYAYGMIVLKDGAVGVNEGTLKALSNERSVTLVNIKDGAKFTNANVIEVGTADKNATQGAGRHSYVFSIKNATFINDGTIDIYKAASNAASGTGDKLFYLYNGGRLENKGTINFAAAEKNDEWKDYDLFTGISTTGTNNSFLNDTSGVINFGIAKNGTSVGVGKGSYLFFAENDRQGTLSENKGQINVGGRVFGTNLIYGHSLNAAIYFTNKGEINLDGNRDKDGLASADAINNVAMYRSGGSIVDFINAGTINVDGYANIAMKATNKAKIRSTGTINVHGNKTDSGLNNYGVWVEDAGSEAEISGKVNLTGDNSIATFASNGGKINLTGSGAVTFANGSNQIGYYLYGQNSSLNNTSSSAQDVSTANSTLMRLAGGASLTGSSASTMTASGKGATVIVATDSGTSVNSGGMTIKASGENSVGVRVEGGAQATIDNTTSIELSGSGSIAGVADGQGHHLDGTENGAIDSSTKLVAHANLTSALDNVTGYKAVNQAQVENSGNITFTGKNATAIDVQEGAKGTNSGSIVLNGAGSVGLKASSQDKNTSLVNTGNLTLNGSWDGVDDQTRVTGIFAEGSGVQAKVGDGVQATSIDLNGTGAVGVHAFDGGSVIVADKVAINFQNKEDQIAYWVQGEGSSIKTASGATQQTVAGNGATVFYVTDKAELTGNLNMKISSTTTNTTMGIKASGAGTVATLGNSSQLNIGNNAVGVYAEKGAQANIASGASLKISGNNAIIGKAVDENSIVTNGASVASELGSSGSVAFLAKDGGTINNTGSIDLSIGIGHTAINVDNGHVENTGNIVANGTGIHIKGEDSTISNSGIIAVEGGVAAIHVDSGAGLNLSAVGGTGALVAKGSADGILLDTGALSLDVENTTIDMSDSTATGIGINNKAGISGIKLSDTNIKLGGSGVGIKTGATLDKENSGQIDVTNGTGIVVESGYGGVIATDLDLSDSQDLLVNVTGTGTGLKATLAGGGTAKTGVSVDVKSTNGGAAVDITNAKNIENSGSLTSKSTTAAVLDVHGAEAVTNTGTIKAADSSKTAIAMSNTGNKKLTNTGEIEGKLDFGSGNNTVNLNSGSVKGDIVATGGNNTIEAVGGSTHTGNINLGNGNNTVKVNTAKVGNVNVGSGTNKVSVEGNASQMGDFVGSANSNNTVTIKGDGTNTPTVGKLDAGTGGTDILALDNAKLTQAVTTDIQHFDQITLKNGAALESHTELLMGDTATAVGEISIDADSSLLVESTANYNLNHKLVGAGKISVDTGNNSFNFGAGTGSAFAGDVQLTDTKFNLSGNNTNALTRATLIAGADSVTTVGVGKQNIAGLTFDGGKLDFGTVNAPGGASGSANNNVSVGHLEITGNSGTVSLTPSTMVGNIATTPTSLGLLDQQANDIFISLVDANTVTGNAGNLTIEGITSNEHKADVVQAGNNVAKATYDYRLVSENASNKKGLYVTYGLKELGLIGTGANATKLTTSDSTKKILDAKVTGTGDLEINDNASGMTLANSSNSYTGATKVSAGKLIVGENNALGQTSQLALVNAGTSVDLNGKTQTVGKLDSVLNGTVDIHGGALTVSNGGQVFGGLTGAGNLNVTGGQLAISGANNALNANVAIASGAKVALNNVNGLGGNTGTLSLVGDLDINAIGNFNKTISSGSGTANIQGGGNVNVGGDNAAFSGNFNIVNGSVLTTADSKNLGSATINNAGELHFNTADGSADIDQTYSNTINGAGSLHKDNAGTSLLTGNNAYTGETNINKGILAIYADNNLGTNGTVNLNGGGLRVTKSSTTPSSSIELNRDINFTKNGSIEVDKNVRASLENGWLGNGHNLDKTGEGILVLKRDNSLNTGAVNIFAGMIKVEDMDNVNASTAKVDIAENAVLALDKTGAADNETIGQQLTGSGTLSVDLGNKDKTLNLASSVGTGFLGTVAMDNGEIVLDSGASSSLANATLALNGSGSKVGSINLNSTANQQLGSLEMNGGTIKTTSVGGQVAGTAIVKDLTVTGGSVAIKDHVLGSGSGNSLSSLSYFDQNEIKEQIVKATDTVTGAGAQLTLTDETGASIQSANNTTAITNGSGTQIGNAVYDNIALVVDDGDKKGIYLGYGLSELEAFAGQAVDINNTGAAGNNLGVTLTGAGGFDFDITGMANIGNVNSDYQGKTNIQSGTVNMLTNNSFGKTSELNIVAGAGVNMNGKTQTVGVLTANNGSSLNINDGALIVTDGGLVSGSNTMTGSGSLILQGTNPLKIEGNNSTLTANVDIQSGAEAVLNKPQGLGTGGINNEGVLTLDNGSGTLLNSLTGTAGDVALVNGTNIYFGGNNVGFAGSFTTNTGTKATFTNSAQLGSATVHNSGTTVFDVDNAQANFKLNNIISGTGVVDKEGTGTLIIDTAQTYTGVTNVNNGLMILGSKIGNSAVSLESSQVNIHSSGAFGGYGVLNGKLNNSGILLVGSAAEGALTGHAQNYGSFTVNGDYVGNNGTVVFNTQLGNDASPTDKLVITGDTYGNSAVRVVDSAAGRAGEQTTTNGIELISVQGTNQGAQFSLSGRAVAGAYEYFLYQGGETANPTTDNNWYLRSSPYSGGTKTLRPETGAYIANASAANMLFTRGLTLSTRGYDRPTGQEGSGSGASANSQNAEIRNAAWFRFYTDHGKTGDGSGQLKMTTDSYLAQAGSDIFETAVGDTGSVKLGGMFAYGQAKADSVSRYTNYRAKSKVDGYTFGAYGTWRQNVEELGGAYVDGWLQHAWFKNEVSGDNLAQEKYNTRGVMASLETGYTFDLYQDEHRSIYLEPQAQVIWTGINGRTHKERNGTLVKFDDSNNIQTRLGLRLFGNTDGMSYLQSFRPFVEANWIHNSENANVTFDGNRMSEEGAKNIGEVKLGLEARIGRNTSIWGNVMHQRGNQNYHNTGGQLGIKYHF